MFTFPATVPRRSPTRPQGDPWEAASLAGKPQSSPLPPTSSALCVPGDRNMRTEATRRPTVTLDDCGSVGRLGRPTAEGLAAQIPPPS